MLNDDVVSIEVMMMLYEFVMKAARVRTLPAGKKAGTPGTCERKSDVWAPVVDEEEEFQ